MKSAVTTAFLLFCICALPSFSEATPILVPPATENVGAGQATLVLQSNETGTGYFTLLPGNGTACGTGTQVKAGQNSSGTLVRYRGSLSLPANSPRRYTVVNLPQSTAYTVCFTADSPTGQNLQETPTTSNFATSAAISLTDKEWKTVGSADFSAGQAASISQVFAPDGTPYIAYSDGANSGKVTVMKFINGAWSAVGLPGFSAYSAQTTAVGHAPDGTISVAYRNSSYQTTVMKFNGTSWVPSGMVNNTVNASLAFSPNGELYAAYTDPTSSNRATVIKLSNGSWSLVGNQGFSSGVASAISLAFTSSGNPYVAFKDNSASNRIVVYKLLGTWTPVGSPISVTTSGFTRLSISADDIPYLAYQNAAGAAAVMRFAGVWMAAGSGVISPGAVTDLSLAVSPDGTPAVAFQDSSVVGSKATVMKLTGGSWGVLGSGGFSADSANPVSVAFAPDGRPYAAYGSGTAGKATVMRLDISNTTTTVSSDKVVASAGETVTFTAAISKTAATGSVSFKDGATLLGTAQLSNGVATFSTANLSVGFHAITAVYAGDSNFIGSTSQAQQIEIRPIGFAVVSAIASPVSGYATNAPDLTVSGAAASVDGDPVLLVEVSIDGGSTWQTATGTTSWSRTFSFPLEGNFTIRSRATTTAGIVETPAAGISVTIDRTAPTGTIVSAVQNSSDSLTVTLNTTANTPGMGCYGVFPNACGFQEIALSYDGVTWTPWQQVMTTRQYSITMVGRQTTVYARLRDSAGNVSVVLSAPVQINGVCGSANNSNFVAIPTTGLCALGTPSAVTGNGPWSWFCSDSYGGTTASCSAKQAGGIVYRSTDSGITWSAVKSGSGYNSSADALLVSPAFASDHTLFLGADGIYKSVDSGDTFKKVLAGYMVKAFAASPAYAEDRTIFAGAYLSGIYKSSDAGDTWVASNVGLSPTMVFSLAISPGFSTDHTIFAGTYSAGVYKSSDGGATWSAANAGISTLSAVSLAISPGFATDHTLFAAVTNGTFGGGPTYEIYKSTDGGLTWNRSDSGISGSISELGISPGYVSDRTIFVVTGTGMYKSTDGGTLWTQVTTYPSGNSLVLSPGYAADQTVFTGVYGDNVFKSISGGSTWSPSNSSFGVENKIISLAISPSFASDRTVFAVTSLVGPNLSLFPNSLSFGAVTINSTSLTRQITIKNDLYGDANLDISNLVLRGFNAGMFTLAPGTCGSLKPMIPIGGQCDIDVTFKPTTAGSKSVILEISSNGVSPAEYSLDGIGAVPGECGGDNGKSVAAAIPVNLCQYGTPSPVSGNGHPWSWICQGDAGTAPVACGASIASFNVSVAIKDGEGKGNIQADLASDDSPPITIFCPASFCSAHFDFGRRVRLTATPDPVSQFTAWEGVCSANPCEIEVTADTAVTALFTRDAIFKNVRSGELINSLDLLLLSLNPGDEIRMLAANLQIDSLELNQALTLSGGWLANHDVQAANPTVLTGAITVLGSGIGMDTLMLKGQLIIKGGALSVQGVTLQQ